MGAGAQHQRRHAGGLGGEREATGGGEVKRLGIAPGLDEDEPERAAAQALLGGAQHVARIRGGDDQQGGGVEAEGGEAGPVRFARLAPGEILPHPQPGPRQPARAREARRAGQGEAAGGGGVARRGRPHLVHRPASQTAAQHPVRPRMAERRRGVPLRPGEGARPPVRADGGDALPQRGQEVDGHVVDGQRIGVRGQAHGSTVCGGQRESSCFVPIRIPEPVRRVNRRGNVTVA